MESCMESLWLWCQEALVLDPACPTYCVVTLGKVHVPPPLILSFPIYKNETSIINLPNVG